ncbi:MAG: APC family permease [Candidatus Omnitrophica bacterium]|nr:APC family permease [Candidatus Omnitrophota bacterium]
MAITSFFKRMKDVFIGKARSYADASVFHTMSLVAFLAWVGLGADGLSSSCYGPPESFATLLSHPHLILIVGVATAATVFIISASYSQIIELFPAGGGGYLVASKLLSPMVGMISGCALLIDYILTITVSIASGADAVFSLLPYEWNGLKLSFAALILVILMIMNLRGVRETVMPLVPVFLLFLATHAFLIIYGITTHVPEMATVTASLKADASASFAQLGLMGTIALILKAYSMGAGTYTGIEAVSNGVYILREPKVQTAKSTMRYMATSLAVVVMGLMLGYLLFKVVPEQGKTLNAVLLERMTVGWPQGVGHIFILLTLLAEAILLFVAGQTGFIGGPRVLANMALDRWFPTRFAAISDRLVSQNGILIMGGAALLILIVTQGSVALLVVLYSINVFITFVLSQLGMVKHWWQEQGKKHSWKRKMLVNLAGLVLSGGILISMVVIKFQDGGWATLVVTSLLILAAFATKKHYWETAKKLKRLNSLTITVQEEIRAMKKPPQSAPLDHLAKTAVIFVSGFNGLGLHTLFNTIRFFPGVYKNFIFVQIGVIDAGNFKGEAELQQLKTRISNDVEHYVTYMHNNGYSARGITLTGVDVVQESERIALDLAKKHPGAVFFGGQLVFPEESFITRLLHNHTVFALQKRLYQEGLLFVILPIRI